MTEPLTFKAGDAVTATLWGMLHHGVVTHVGKSGVVWVLWREPVLRERWQFAESLSLT